MRICIRKMPQIQFMETAEMINKILEELNDEKENTENTSIYDIEK